MPQYNGARFGTGVGESSALASKCVLWRSTALRAMFVVLLISRHTPYLANISPLTLYISN
jgi:hypothetical protein